MFARSTLTAIGTLVAVAASASAAHARGAGSDETPHAARADELFARGKTAMAAGRYAEACAAFDESYGLDPSEGTLLALGLCHEKSEDLVRAFAELRDVHASAVSSGRDDRQRVARAALARVSPRIGRVLVRASGDGALGDCRAIALGSTTLAASDLGVELPVTPGSHRIVCERARGAPWAETVAVSAGALGVVVIPLEERADTPTEARSPAREDGKPDTDEGDGTGARTLGFALGGVGLVGLGVGAFFGVRAFGLWADVEAKCDPAACNDPSARDDADAARTSATVANVAVIAGAALVAAGVYVLLSSARSADARGAQKSSASGASLLPPRFTW